jgi:hypothetical protein
MMLRAAELMHESVRDITGEAGEPRDEMSLSP